MKKILIFTLLTLSFFVVNAQRYITAEEEFYTLEEIKKEKKPKIKTDNPFNITIGFMAKSSVSEYDGIKDKTSFFDQEDKMATTFVFGISRIWDMTNGVSFEAGLNAEYTFEKYTNFYAPEFLNLNLSVPIRFQYQYEIFDDFRVFAFAGPSLDFMLGENDDMFWEYADIKRTYNVMLGAGGGVQWKILKLRIGTEWGLMNCASYEARQNGDYLRYNKPLTVTLSFMM